MSHRVNKLIAILRVPFYRRALVKHGVAAAVEHESLLGKIGSELKTIGDIGANRGQFSLVSSKNAPLAHIIAFEPLEEPAEIFREVFSGDANVELFPFAIGTENGDALMHVSRADDSSSLLPVSALQRQLFHGTAESGTRLVSVRRLDEALGGDQIAEPALLKIDVQGFELEALKSCGALLVRFNFLLVECSYVELYTGQALAGEVLEYLNKAGFGLVERANLAKNKNDEPVQADFFFRRI